MVDQPNLLDGRRLSRRGLLKGVAATGALALLAACGRSDTTTSQPAGGAAATTAPTAATGGGAAAGGTAVTAPTTAPAAPTTAPAAAPPTTAPTGGAGVTTVTWFAGRDTTGYTPKAVEAFNAQSRTIKIDYQEQGATTDDLRNKFVTIASAKDPTADIVSADVPFVPEFGAAGWTIPLDEYLPQSERGAFFKGTLDGATYDGKLYAIPWFNNGPVLFYRKDLLGSAGLQPPKTYDELVATCKRLQSGDLNGLIIQTVQNEGGVINWYETLWGYGGEIVDDKLNVLLDQGSTGVDSLKRFVDYIYVDKIVPEATLTMRTSADAANAFAEGRGVFLRMWMSQVSVMEGPTSKIKGQWDIATLPSKDGSKPGPGCLGTWNLAISAYSKRPKEAAEAIKFLTSLEQQKARYLTNGNLPTRPAVFGDAEVKAKYEFVEKLLPAFEALKPRPVTPFYGQMSNNALQPHFGAAVSRQKTPDQAIKDMAAELRKIVKG